MASHRAITLRDLFGDARHLMQMFYKRTIGPKLAELRIQWALGTYRFANVVFFLRQQWAAAVQASLAAHNKVTHIVAGQLHSTVAKTQAEADMLASYWLVAVVVGLLVVVTIRWKQSSTRRLVASSK